MGVHIGDAARRSEGDAELKGLSVAVDPVKPILTCILYGVSVRTAQ